MIGSEYVVSCACTSGSMVTAADRGKTLDSVEKKRQSQIVAAVAEQATSFEEHAVAPPDSSLKLWERSNGRKVRKKKDRVVQPQVAEPTSSRQGQGSVSQS